MGASGPRAYSLGRLARSSKRASALIDRALLLADRRPDEKNEPADDRPAEEDIEHQDENRVAVLPHDGNKSRQEVDAEEEKKHGSKEEADHGGARRCETTLSSFAAIRHQAGRASGPLSRKSTRARFS